MQQPNVSHQPSPTETSFTPAAVTRNHMSAILADGSGKVVWQNENRLYVPSLLIRNNILYGVLDAGIAAAWDASTGQELWKHRLGGTFSASPILAGNQIYAFNESGETFIYTAFPDRFELLEKNKLGEELLATPVICNGCIYYRCTGRNRWKTPRAFVLYRTKQIVTRLPPFRRHLSVR